MRSTKEVNRSLTVVLFEIVCHVKDHIDFDVKNLDYCVVSLTYMAD